MKNSLSKKTITKIEKTICAIGLAITIPASSYLVYSELFPKKVASYEAVEKTELEKIMDVTQKIMTKADYKVIDKENKPRILTVYFSGSAVGIYKNFEEKLIMFLTCNHVITVPENLFVFSDAKFKSIENGFYKENIFTKNGDSLEAMISESEKIEDFEFLMQNATLVSSESGIFAGFKTDLKTGKNIPSYEKIEILASTNFREEVNDFKNDDIALVKISYTELFYKNFYKYSVWESLWTDYELLKEGDNLVAVGFPGSFEKQVCEGILRNKKPHHGKETNYLLTQIPLNHGNSGGPVFLEKIKIEGDKLIKRYYFTGLGRLGFFNYQNITGIVRPDTIKNFLTSQGYSYIFKR